MSNWPPQLEEILEVEAGTHFSAYNKKIQSELISIAPYFRELSQSDQYEVVNVILELDSYAGGVASKLQISPFTVDELRWGAPPRNANRGRQLKEWRRHREHQACIDAAYRARIAIFEGDWIRAVRAALEAGNHSLGGLAEIGRKVLESVPIKGSIRGPDKAASARWDAIFTEAREILSKNQSLSDSGVARTIAKRHRNDSRFPTIETIRKRLAAMRKLVRQGLHPQI